MQSIKKVFIGEVLQLAGVGVFVVGVVTCPHHWPTALIVAGVIAFFWGKRLRGV